MRLVFVQDMDHVLPQIHVLVVQDMVHLIVDTQFAMESYQMKLVFVQEKVLVPLQIHVAAIVDTLVINVKIIHALEFQTPTQLQSVLLEVLVHRQMFAIVNRVVLVIDANITCAMERIHLMQLYVPVTEHVLDIKLVHVVQDTLELIVN
jgi:hypothetical protein